MDIQQSNDGGLRELALFAGAGGGILGGKLLGWRTVCAVEFDPYARDVLVARQNDGCLPPFPIWDDVRTFDGKPWRGIIDVVSGGFPCQDISVAGKGAGIGGERSGLWREMARIVGEVRPRFVWVENSPMLVGRGLGLVLLDLAALGYDARWGVVGACDAGAPHRRERIWIRAVSHTDMSPGCTEHEREREERAEQPGRGGANQLVSWDDVADTTHDRAGRREQQPQGGESSRDVADAEEPGLERPESAGNPRTWGRLAEHGQRRRQAGWWQSEPDVGRMVDRVAARMDRLRCIGNGQVPSCMALAWKALTSENDG
jgi:DNA (cytosine-5)-methyltransferase 1